MSADDLARIDQYIKEYEKTHAQSGTTEPETILPFKQEKPPTQPKTVTTDTTSPPVQEHTYTQPDAVTPKDIPTFNPGIPGKRQAWARHGVGLVLTGSDIQYLIKNGRYKDENDFMNAIKYVRILRDMDMSMLQQDPGRLEGLTFKPFALDKEIHPSKMLVIWARHQPNPFEASYLSPDDLKEEMQTAAQRHLLDEFNWDVHIGFISYTIFQ